MKVKDIISESLISEIDDTTVLGIDIGSRNAKAVLLRNGNLYTSIIATGINMQDTAEELLEDIFEQAQVTEKDIQYVVGTGYGRVSFQLKGIPMDIITEISCHAMGAHFLNENTRTIIDIGGQDAKAIQVNAKTGKVDKFRMNDKCAAGTGRFLEKVASILGYTVEEVGKKSLESTKAIEISSQCVVFAESEVISLRAQGYSSEDIAAGVHMASAKRVIGLLNQIPLDEDIVFTGGVSNNVGMRKAFETLLGHKFKETKLNMVFAGALGAAVYAQQLLRHHKVHADSTNVQQKVDFSDLERKINDAELSFVERTDVKKVGYLCTYTPVELLSAAGIASLRLAKCGTPDVVSQGEMITKSVFCDVTKSVLGYFMNHDPLYEAVDEVAIFYTCDSMRSTSDAIDNYYKPVKGYVVPRGNKKESVRAMFRDQILAFKRDMETLSGNVVTDDILREKILLYKNIKTVIRNISELRKQAIPPLSGSDFLTITRAYRTLPAEEQLPILENLYEKLKKVKNTGKAPVRIMVVGGMISDGDRTIMDILEKDLNVSVVIEDHCTGFSQFARENNTSLDDPWQYLANEYLDQAPCARQNPITERVDFAANLAKEYQVDGVILTYIKFCPCYGMTKKLFIDKFEELGIPLLEQENSYMANDAGQIKTRLEAFIEVIKEKKGADDFE
ncbi:MAG: 2-hydroxyacyl-CoA dehydratase [Lachnospiraceae bacterium]